MSVCLSDSCPAHNYFWFDIGLPYLAHGCIAIRRCVVYIHDPDTTLNFDLKLKGVFDMSSSPAHNFFLVVIGLPYLAHGCITTRRCVTYIHDPESVNLTFDLKVFMSYLKHLFALTLAYHIWHMGLSP